MSLKDLAAGFWRRGWFRALVIVGAALVLAVATALMRTSSPGSAELAERSSLHPWSMLGCHALRLGSWTASPTPGAAGAEGTEMPGREPSPAADAPPSGDSGEPEGLSQDVLDLLSSVAPPSEVMLLPDSVDRWGRVLPSYRASALPGSLERERSLRWFVRADTLWFLWSERGIRAGMALQETRDGLRGRARALSGADSLDASAVATAWPINCATLAPRRTPAWERR